MKIAEIIRDFADSLRREVTVILVAVAGDGERVQRVETCDGGEFNRGGVDK